MATDLLICGISGGGKFHSDNTGGLHGIAIARGLEHSTSVSASENNFL